MTETTRGPVLMALYMLAFTLNDVCLKAIDGALPVPQVLFLRGLMTVAVLGVLAWRTGALRRVSIRGDAPLLLIRTAGEVGAAFFFVAAIFSMPLVNAVAVLQAVPLAVTAAGALVLGERVGPRRWAAVVVGLVGVLLILRPGVEGFDGHALYALAAVGCVTLRDVATRRLARSVPPGAAALAAGVGVTLTAALFLPGASMAPVSLGVWALLAGSAAFLMTAYLMSVVVMRAAEVSVTAPFRYTGLLWALILGLAIFGEWPDPATLLGAAIVVGSGLFALRRERVVAARGAPPSCGRRNR